MALRVAVSPSGLHRCHYERTMSAADSPELSAARHEQLVINDVYTASSVNHRLPAPHPLLPVWNVPFTGRRPVESTNLHRFHHARTRREVGERMERRRGWRLLWWSGWMCDVATVTLCRLDVQSATTIVAPLTNRRKVIATVGRRLQASLVRNVSQRCILYTSDN